MKAAKHWKVKQVGFKDDLESTLNELAADGWDVFEIFRQDSGWADFIVIASRHVTTWGT